MKIFKKSIALLLSIIMLISAMVTVTSAAVVDNPFTDVKPSAWYASAVAYCLAHDYVSGMTPTEFRPNGNLTRAQFVTLLANIAEADLSDYADVDSGFADVKISHWFHDVVTWAKEMGYVSGTSDTTFSPNAKVTREQMARIFYVYTEKNGYDVSKRTDLSSFTDENKISSWAKDQVSWAVAVGIINGMTENTLGPRGNATRAQATQIIMVYTQLKFPLAGNAFEALVSNLEIDEEGDDDSVGSYENIIIEKETDTLIENEYVEIVHCKKTDMLFFKYSYYKDPIEESEHERDILEEMFLCGAVFNGTASMRFGLCDTKEGTSLYIDGIIKDGKFVYVIDSYEGYEEDEIFAFAEFYINTMWGTINKDINDICGFDLIDITEDAPVREITEESSVFEKIIYSISDSRVNLYPKVEYSKTINDSYEEFEGGNSEHVECFDVSYVAGSDYGVCLYNIYDAKYYYDETDEYTDITLYVFVNEDGTVEVEFNIYTDKGWANCLVQLFDDGNYAYAIYDSDDISDEEVRLIVEENIDYMLEQTDACLIDFCGVGLADLN